MVEKTFRLPDIGEGVAEAELVEWLIKEGDLVLADQDVAVVTTDKANVEIPSPFEGRIVSLGGMPGDIIAVGSMLVTIEVEGAEGENADENETSSPNVTEEAFRMPDIGEGVAEAELVEWLVEVGDNVTADQDVAIVTTDKANLEIPSPFDGRITWLGAKSGETIAVGAPLLKIEVQGAASTSPPQQSIKEPDAPEQAATPFATADTPMFDATATTRSEKALAAPAVRARAAALGLTLSSITGSGPDGRVTHADLDALRSSAATPAKPATPFVAPTSKAPIEQRRLTPTERAMARKMGQSKPGVVHFSYVEEVEVEAVEQRRAAFNEGKDKTKQVSILAFIARAFCLAVQKTPVVNALFNGDTQELHIYDEIRLGLAVQTDNGLMVPNIQAAENYSVAELGDEIKRVAKGAREGTLARDELVGSTVTLTSLGAMGGIVTTPVINAPEVAIVSVNRVRTAPVWTGESFEPRKVMNLSGSFDHRVVDGHTAASFILEIKRLLESPEEL